MTEAVRVKMFARTRAWSLVMASLPDLPFESSQIAQTTLVNTTSATINILRTPNDGQMTNKQETL